MSKLNVLFLNSWYPNAVYPFNGNFIQQHARAISHYCNVGCLNIEAKEQKKNIEVSKKYNNGVLEVIVYTKKTKGVLSFPKKMLLKIDAYKKGYELIISELGKIDIIHLNVVLTAGVYALHLKRKYNVPFVITEHSTRYLPIRKDGHNFIEKKILRKVTKKASKICPVSKDLQDAMLRSGYKGDYQVIPNVVNTKYFKFNKVKESDFTKILHVSSLKKEHKNWEGILNVVKELSLERNDFSLTIVSDGDLEPVKKYAQKLKIDSDFLEIVGEKTTPEIGEIMQQHDVFLLFSNFENLPCVISEALVSGMPVISSDVGGIKEMVNKKNGILVEAGNEKELLNTLNTFFDSKRKYNRHNIAKEAELVYSYTAVAKKFMSIYNEVLKE
jgi:glycosyltransferase involved in cell wall biosynthesis